MVKARCAKTRESRSFQKATEEYQITSRVDLNAFHQIDTCTAFYTLLKVAESFEVGGWGEI